MCRRCSVEAFLSLELFLILCLAVQLITMPDLVADLCFDDVRLTDMEAHIYHLCGIGLLGMGSFVLHALLRGNVTTRFLNPDIHNSPVFFVPLVISVLLALFSALLWRTLRGQDTEQLVNRQAPTPW